MAKANTVDGQYVPLLWSTMDSPAWRAMSHGARSLFLLLRRQLDKTAGNNGRVYVSVRDACEDLGSCRDQVGRWFKELQHFGFIVMTSPGGLGSEGKGKAPHWRLTDCGRKKGNPRQGGSFETPTRDFLKWDGTPFKRPPPPLPKNKTPSRKKRTGASAKKGTGSSRKKRTGTAESVPEKADIQDLPAVPEKGDITRVPVGGLNEPPSRTPVNGKRPKSASSPEEKRSEHDKRLDAIDLALMEKDLSRQELRDLREELEDIAHPLGDEDSLSRRATELLKGLTFLLSCTE